MSERKKTTDQSQLVGLGLSLGGGIGLMFGAASNAPEIGLIYGGGLGLVVATVLSALANRRLGDNTAATETEFEASRSRLE